MRLSFVKIVKLPRQGVPFPVGDPDADLPVVIPYGEGEILPVLGRADGPLGPFPQHEVERFHAGRGVVQQRAVPVPDKQFDGCVVHGEQPAEDA